MPVKSPELLKIIRKILNEVMISQMQELNHLNKDKTYCLIKKEIFKQVSCMKLLV